MGIGQSNLENFPEGQGDAVPNELNSWDIPTSDLEHISLGLQTQQETIYGPGFPPWLFQEGASILPWLAHTALPTLTQGTDEGICIIHRASKSVPQATSYQEAEIPTNI